jgi:hypothetical protein
MQIHDNRLHRLKGPNMYTLRRIKYSTDNLGGINNYKLLKLILETTLACPYTHSYS